MVRKKESLQCVLVEKYTVAPAPSRDYFGIKADISNIYLYHWRISRSHKTKPLMEQFEIDKFSVDSSLHEEIEYIFGKEVLSHLLLIAKGKGDCFTALPRQILVHICSFLKLRDVGALACTCKKMSKMESSEDLFMNTSSHSQLINIEHYCSCPLVNLTEDALKLLNLQEKRIKNTYEKVTKTDEVWKQLYMNHYPKKKLSKEEKTGVSHSGWRKFFKKKYVDSKGLSSSKTVSFIGSNKIKRTVRPATTQMNITDKKKPSLHSHNNDIRPKTSSGKINDMRSKVAKPKSVDKTSPKLSNKIKINSDNKTVIKATSNLTSLQLPSPQTKRSPQTLLSLPSTPCLSSSNILPLTLPSTSSSTVKKSTLKSPKTKQPNANVHSELMNSPRVSNSFKLIPSPRTPTKYDFKAASTSKLNVIGSNTLKSPRLVRTPR